MDGSTDENPQYAFENTNWETFGADRDMAGFYGYSDKKTGELRGLGFVEKDPKCFKGFMDDGAENWYSCKTAECQTRPVVPEAFRAKIEELEQQKRSIAGGKLPEHSHDQAQEDGVIAVTVLVWAAFAVLGGGLLAMMCMKKKGGKM